MPCYRCYNRIVQHSKKEGLANSMCNESQERVNEEDTQVPLNTVLQIE